MKAIDLRNCEIGTVSSQKDGSVAFRVHTAELRASEAGAVMQYHGKACRVLIAPHDVEPDETMEVDAEREHKTPSQRLRSVLFLWFKQEGKIGEFDAFYRHRMEQLIEHVKAKLKP